jgi:hypothetical protein
MNARSGPVHPPSSERRTGSWERIPRGGLIALLGALPALPLGGQQPNPNPVSSPILDYEGGVKVYLQSEPRPEVEPGNVVSLSFRIENRSRELQRFQEAMTLPALWSLVLPPSEFTLEAGESMIRILLVRPDAAAPAGIQGLRYTVASVHEPAVHGHAHAEIELRPVRALRLRPARENPAPLVVGEVSEIEFHIVNPGNVPEEVSLSASLSLPGRVDVIPQALALPPQGRSAVTVRLLPNRGPPEGERARLILAATTLDEEGGYRVAARTAQSLEVLVSPEGADPWHRLPLMLSVFMADRGTGSMAGWGLRSEGYLDDRQKRYVQLLFRSPEPRGAAGTAFGENIQASLLGPWLSLEAGHRAFTVSELSALGRQGLGARIAVHPPGTPLALSGFIVRDRFPIEERTDRGASLSLRSWQGSGRPQRAASRELRVNLLELAWSPSEGQPARRDYIGTLAARLDLGPLLSLDGEVARSWADSPGESEGEAWRLSASGRSRSRSHAGSGWEYRAWARRAAPEFGGRLPDMATAGGHLGGPLFKGVRGSLGINHDARNVDALPERGPAPRERRVEAGMTLPINGSLPGDLRLSLGYDRHRRWDALLGAEGRSLRERIRLGLAHGFGAFRYRAELRRAEAWDASGAPATTVVNYSLSGAYRASRTFSFRGQVRLGREEVWGDHRLGWETSDYSGTLRWEPADRLWVTASYTQQGKRVPDEPLRERQALEHYGLAAGIILLRDQEIRMEVRRSEGRLGIVQTQVSLGYQWQLGMPLSRRGSVGRLSGELLFLGPDGPAPMADTLIRVGGLATRTDRWGRFEIRALPQGEYPVHVDLTAYGSGVIVASGASPKVRIPGGGRATEARLTYLQGATVRGILTLALAQPSQDDPRALALVTPTSSDFSGILVEMAAGEDVRRTLSRPGGDFLFQLLPPGVWTLRVYPHGLPPGHRLEQEVWDVRIEPGQTHHVSVPVLPIERRIRFIEEGTSSTQPVPLVPPGG